MRTLKQCEPFLLSLAVPVRGVRPFPYRYSRVRQVGQVLVRGRWRDVDLVRETGPGETYITRVQRETTDDK